MLVACKYMFSMALVLYTYVLVGSLGSVGTGLYWVMCVLVYLVQVIQSLFQGLTESSDVLYLEFVMSLREEVSVSNLEF